VRYYCENTLNQIVRIMSSAQIKKLLKEQIDDADDRLLKMIHAMVKAYQNTDDAFSFDSAGNPISANQMRKELEEEIGKAKDGKYIRDSHHSQSRRKH